MYLHIGSTCVKHMHTPQACKKSTIIVKNKMAIRTFSFLSAWSLISSEYLKSSDAKASKCHLKFSSLIMIFVKLVYLSSVISLK